MAATSWEERRLCDDGGCTGLIGADGTCKVCGRASKFWGDERRRGMQDDEGDEEELDEEPAVAIRKAAAKAVDDPDERRLCPDGACTGLLDGDGRCKVCGKVDPDALVRTAKPEEETGHGHGHDEENDEENDEDEDEDEEGERKLCPDGSCTGLVGSDGTCSVCGRSAEA